MTSVNRFGELTSTVPCPALGRGLPTGALPTNCFLAALAGGFALGFRARPVAFVALAGLDLGLGMLPPIRGQGSADIVGFNERRAQLVAAHIPFIGPSIDQLSLAGHPFTFRFLSCWLSLSRPPERLNFLGLAGETFIALSDYLAGLLWSVGARVASLIHLLEHVGQERAAGRLRIHRKITRFARRCS
jgi:hypothetical protein